MNQPTAYYYQVQDTMDTSIATWTITVSEPYSFCDLRMDCTVELTEFDEEFHLIEESPYNRGSPQNYAITLRKGATF